jgi:PAS domain S-box-containing protein
MVRLLVGSVRDYDIFMLDPQGIVLTWNAGAEALKGYQPSEIIGQHFSKFYPEDAIAKNWPAHELSVATAEGRFEDEGWRLRGDGSNSGLMSLSPRFAMQPARSPVSPRLPAI